MKKFLIRLCLLLVLCTGLIGAGCYAQKDDILCITDSTSMDIRLYDIHRKQIKDLDIASIGSSTNLNSINSRIFLDNLELKTAGGETLPGYELSYYNFANWGIRVRAEQNMLNCVLMRSTPKMVVMVGTPMDFYEDTFYDDVDWGIISAYLDGNPITDIPAYLKGGRPYNDGLWEKYVKFVSQNQDQYENMEMDEWGGSYMNVLGDNIDPGRWNDYLRVEQMQEEQIQAFARMAERLNKKGITFVYVSAPCRITFAQDQTAKNYLKELNERLASICEENGHYFYNAENFDKYTDDYFSDCNHLNKAGAEIFTADMTEWINENVTVR